MSLPLLAPIVLPFEDIFRERCDAHAVLVANGLYELQYSVDVLWQVACDYGLVDQLGVDAVQAIISTEFVAAC